MHTKDEKLYLQYKDAYYNAIPLVSDDVFDALEEKIRRTNPNSSVLTMVGANNTTDYLIKHNKEMLSLNKTYDQKELSRWSNNEEVCYSYKMDGMAASFVYTSNDGLVLAKTRGDGIFGKNITKNIAFMNIPIVNFNIEIRGEVVITKNKFIELVEQCNILNVDAPTSMRNAVAGLLNPNKKTNIQLASYLDFYAYDLIGIDTNTDFDMFMKLRELGFNTPIFGLVSSLSDIINIYDNSKQTLDYLTDGIVFSINNKQLQESLGNTSHHPKGKMAFKLQNEQGVTTVENITYDVGKNGKISFVANVEPILLSGATIKNVTLHNAKYILDNDISIGSKINIIRSGEVIPKFLSIADNSGVIQQYNLPTNCPSCNHKLIWSETYTDLMCTNNLCHGQVLRSIIHWCKTIEIGGVSEGILSYLYEIGLITNYKDIYKLTEADLKYLPGFGETSAANIILSINTKKVIDSDKFIIGLNISGIGRGTSKDIMKYFKTINNFIKWLDLGIYDQLLNIDGISHKTAFAIDNNSQYIQTELTSLINLGVTIIDNYNINTVAKSLSFCVTGTLSKNRNDIHKDIEAKGFEVKTSVNKELSYLVCNDSSSNSSKVRGAIKHGIKIISEKELYKILQEN